MSFINSYRPPIRTIDPEPFYGPDPYDVNFMFPIDTSALESDRVLLTPFIPSIHAQQYIEETLKNPELERYLPFQPSTISQLLHFVEYGIRRDPGWVLFAITDKGRPDPDFGGGSFAGVIGLLHTSATELCTEIGFVVTFTAFQRTYVTSNAVGLLLRYCLELPSPSFPAGLGLRRVVWMANAVNLKSVAAAERMGFKREGTLRWVRALPEGKEGYPPREGDSKPKCLGRHSAILSLCWDDWEAGARERG
ncbi:hypothetical protein DENSPDRAFT_686696 [Dentipellis sp. KUC8613]|nr:hypothetical protein DENSPDRAFT_686696 [Dentipellis sp. KUC8613]